MRLRIPMLLFAAAAVLAAQTGGAVNGSVTNTVSGQPIKRAYVVLRGIAAADNAGPVETYVCHSDPDGKFSVADVVPGRYEVEAARAGFQAKPPNRASNANYLPQILVEAGKPVTGVSLRLTPLGWIAGKVTDEAGDVVIDADVEVMQYRYVQGKKVLQRVGSSKSDDRGEYAFSDLAPGRYYVRAARLQHDPPLMGDVANRGPGRTRVYMPGYFGGARAAAQASALEVAPGAELEPVNIQVRRVSIYAIRGFAPPGSSVSLVRPQGEPGFSYATRPIGGSREHFEMDGIPPGTYPVRVSLPQQAGLFAFRRVEVRDQDVEGLDLRQPTGREVSGSVSLNGPAAASMAAVQVLLRPEEAGAGTEVDGPVQPNPKFLGLRE